MKSSARRRLAIVVLVCVAGCSDQSTTRTAAKSQGLDTSADLDAQRSQAAELSETTVDGIVLLPTKTINGRLSLLVPSGFEMMDDDSLRLKYPSQRRPTLVYTNDAGSVNVAINHTNDRMPQSQINAFHKQMDGMFRNLYPSATWFNSGVIDINERDWLTLDLRTPAVDTDIRNIMIGTSVEGRLLLVSFNVTKELEDKWIKAAKAIVQSLRVED